MKAFWTSVAAAIVVAVLAGVVLNYGFSYQSKDIYQSSHGSVRL